MTNPGRFSQDTDAQQQYIRYFQQMVDRSGRNVQIFQQHVDESAQYFQGHAANKFREYQAQVHVECVNALDRLSQISESLGTGFKATQAAEDQGVAAFAGGAVT